MNSRWQRAMIEAIPEPGRLWMRAMQRRFRLQAVRTGTIDWGGLRRTAPISTAFGLDRGLPVERYYIEKFLAAHAADIRGHVLEFGDDRYTRRFGDGRVVRGDVMDLVADKPHHTIRGDLTSADHIADGTFDCIICTQTLQMIFEIGVAVRQVERILKPGGVLLMTSHGISRIARREGIDDWGEYWRVTGQAAARLFGDVFGPSAVTVSVYGSVLTAVASLHGMAVEELAVSELEYHDPSYEVIVAVRAVKQGSAT